MQEILIKIVVDILIKILVGTFAIKPSATLAVNPAATSAGRLIRPIGQKSLDWHLIDGTLKRPVNQMKKKRNEFGT